MYATEPSTTPPKEPAPLPKPSERLGIYLDLSKKCTGWCVAIGRGGSQDGNKGEIIDHGTWVFADKSRKHRRSDGQMLQEFLTLLSDLIDTYKPDVIVYENAINQKARAGELFYAMAGVMKMVAHSSAIPVFMVHPTTLKKWGAGDAKASKLEVIKAVNKRHGFQIEDDNEADAIAMVLAAWQLAIYGELRQAA